MNLPAKILWIVLAGGLGALARYGLSGLAQRHMGLSFPWGTLLVNMAGCFCFGVIWAMAEERMMMSGNMRSILLIGFMGAFTTFSSFAFETSQLIRDAEWLLAGVNVVGQNVCGVLFLVLGIALGRII
jgi:fluoride exporter